MICFPNAKINIGLNIINKRKDGYHNIETILYPIRFYDILECVISDEFKFTNTGLQIDCNLNDNLCVKTYRLLKHQFNIPPVHIHLHKLIPFGSGLGGGAANASFLLKVLNEINKINIPENQLIKYARTLGSDCAFFVKNQPCFAYNKGDKFKTINIDLSQYYIIVVYPNIRISTQQAYKNIQIKNKKYESLQEIINIPIREWQNVVKNDFEDYVFSIYPMIARIKELLYKQGAIYASLNGSGSSVYGIFENKKSLGEIFKGYMVHISPCIHEEYKILR